MRLPLIPLSAAFLALHANAQSALIGWSGTDCNGTFSNLAHACDGTCFDFGGRQSIEVIGAAATVTGFPAAECSGTASTLTTDSLDLCVPIGSDIVSFMCS
ncbi:hypothetical protein FB45DRAFT_956821 [Roridomyces roridus]|uniref:Uncharacterized protein n=1 Tax=Roridomyces roridus TaxID=1738132 RepID=A0AAD7F954_9AGAR|nr:hypothetical protein FB45DRAFT_956821 [Roridomyces roridus]